MIRRSLPLLSLLLLTACPKEDHSSAHPTASAAASPGDANVMAGPSTMPRTPPIAEAPPKIAAPSPAANGEMVVNYRWSGGFSVYQYQTLTIRGTDTAKVLFLVKPVRTDEKRVDDVLDAAQFAE